jgi:hypothetical protein
MALLLYNVPRIGFAKHNTRYTTNSHFLAFIEGNQADTSPDAYKYIHQQNYATIYSILMF